MLGIALKNISLSILLRILLITSIGFIRGILSKILKEIFLRAIPGTFWSLTSALGGVRQQTIA